MPDSEQAAATAAAELISGAEGEETPSGSEEETTNEVEFPTFDIELPADIAALLEEPSDEDLAPTDAEVDALVDDNEDVPREVLARLAAAEKRAKHLETLRVTEAKKNWAAEAQKFFPLAEPFLSEINATSRRGYLSTAKQVHEKMKPIVEEKVLKPARDAIEAEKGKAVAEGKEEAKKSWGQPVKGDEAPSDAQVTLQRTQERRNRGELSDTIRNMLFPKGAE